MTNNNVENMFTYEDYEGMAECLLSRQPHRPSIGIICGSGLIDLANKLEERYNVPFEKVPKFPACTVEEQKGEFCFGTLKGKTVVMMRGPFHLYEGYPAWKVASPIRVMKVMGVHTVIVTSASGALNPVFNLGDIMVNIDHVGIPSLAGTNPLDGKNDERFGSRFVDMNKVYDEKLRMSALRVAEELRLAPFTKQGVYLMVGGPSYPTPAEARFLRSLGGDAVGMSIVPEVVAARHCGMRALGLSLITDLVTMDYGAAGVVAHDEDVLETVKWRAMAMNDLVVGVVERLDCE
ncbi:purine nucleoside phosphorylase-like [Lytechinus variegatus]|uniref:purine nucleoside phosphorylase-like n=1 Tax=Lytechinus variegatus TaxID=7654 RepID=UPI001BB15ABF|nr:purine nucleoside phosphorylase-like [Lytechinus variegatus]